MRAVHEFWGWVAVVLTGVVGGWGLVIDRRRQEPGRSFWAALGVAVAAMAIQVAMGVYMVASPGYQPGDQHVFYGIVVAFVLAFAYIYRAQMAVRPALRYGLFLLFTMGLGLRAITTFGVDF